MNKMMFAALAAGMMISTSASAVEYAKVVDVVERHANRSVPTQQCRTVNVPVYGSQSRNNGGAIGSVVDGTFGSTEGLVGGIVGGLLGSQIGGGSGKNWATAGGVILGSQIANKQRQNNNVVAYQEQSVCDTVYVTESFVSGYDVTLDYKGHRFVETMKYPPVVGSDYQVRISAQ